MYQWGRWGRINMGKQSSTYLLTLPPPAHTYTKEPNVLPASFQLKILSLPPSPFLPTWAGGGGRDLPYLGMVGRFAMMTPMLAIFDPIGSLFYGLSKSASIFYNLLKFSIQFTPFSLVLDLIDPSFLQNFRSNWVHFSI